MTSVPILSGGPLRLLLVDDHTFMRAGTRRILEDEPDFLVVGEAGAGAEALAKAAGANPDVVILDIGLPGLDGIEVCRQLRIFSEAYVIMLTARDTEVDTVVGLSVGADDYVTKPFSPRELVARVRAVQRRPRRTSTLGQELSLPRQFGSLRINVDSREVHVDDAPIMLTRTEFDVLAALSSRPGTVLSRRQLMEAIWGDSWVGNDNVVDVHVGHLRRKLGDNPALPRYVTTVRGVGYRMGTG
ncbi:MAG TPA: response regulator transcription factor [Mycobacterium sp.]|nr:response regulator transcription factor [Mycobacterium sp.]